MAQIKPNVIERALADKYYWRRLAAEILAEASQNVPHGTDSAVAPPVASLGRILESRLQPHSARVRISPPGPGPRLVPIIAEVETLSPEGVVLLSQSQARRLRRQWDMGRLRGQEQAQHLGERGDAAGAEEEEEGEEGSSPMQDHPGQNCGDAHPGQSHDDYLDSEEEEEEEEHSNPLYRQNSAGARSISPSRRTRERER